MMATMTIEKRGEMAEEQVDCDGNKRGGSKLMAVGTDNNDDR